jgi:hypothetical protein
MQRTSPRTRIEVDEGWRARNANVCGQVEDAEEEGLGGVPLTNENFARIICGR